MVTKFRFQVYDVTDPDSPSDIAIWERGYTEAEQVLYWLEKGKSELKLSFRLAELFVDLADKSKTERDDDQPVLNDDKNEHTNYGVGKGGENKDSIWNKIEI